MPLRILISDDNAGVRRALTQLLSDIHSAEFIETENGRDAVSKALDPGVDIAILDLAMPVMDGLSAARAILKVRPEVPIFLCTMHWSPHLETEAKASGIRKVVSKAQSSILIAAIRELVGEPRTDAGGEERPKAETPITLPPNPTLLPAGANPPPVQPGNGNTRQSVSEQDIPKVRRTG